MNTERNSTRRLGALPALMIGLAAAGVAGVAPGARAAPQGCMPARHAALQTAMPPAYAPQAPGAPATADGARPGNEIGTGQSLPLGDTASNIDAATTRSTIAPNLPSPPVPDAAAPRDYLLAARQAAASWRTGETQQALEMAETRALDRATEFRKTDRPSRSPLVAQIGRALRALAASDRTATLGAIDTALTIATPTAAR